MSNEYLDDMVEDTNMGGSEFSSTESLSSNETSPRASTSSQTSKHNLVKRQKKKNKKDQVVALLNLFSKLS